MSVPASAAPPLILGIAGSPRRGGNSERLLEGALAGARETGARTETLIAAEAGFTPCRGCSACSATGECVIDDGAALYRALDSADGLVVSSPVFFAGVPAPLKALIDRLQPYWAREYVLGEPRPVRRPGGFMLVRGGGDPYGFDAADATLGSALAVLGIDVLDALHIDGVDGLEDLAGRPEAVAAARSLGHAVGLEALHKRAG